MSFSFHTDDLLDLQWVERGGPVVARPTRRGFGTVLIEQSVKSAGGGAEMLCETKGITWNPYFRLSRAEPQKGSNFLKPDQLKSETKEISAKAVRSAGLPKGARLLAVEDKPPIALQVVGSLEAAGAERIRSAGTEEEALQVIENDNFDCVPLDANLHGRPVTDGKICRFRSAKRKPWTSPSARQLLEAITKLLSTSVSVAQLRHQGVWTAFIKSRLRRNADSL